VGKAKMLFGNAAGSKEGIAGYQMYLWIPVDK
jgi:hypothetical protein